MADHVFLPERPVEVGYENATLIRSAIEPAFQKLEAERTRLKDPLTDQKPLSARIAEDLFRAA